MNNIREKITAQRPETKAQSEYDPAAYEKFKIDPTAEISENPVLIKIAGVVIATLMNFSLWIGKAKSRKTFFITSITAAAACGRCSIEIVEGTFRPEANKVLYFDTEQSPFHAQRTIKRICKQIGVEQPGNLIAYGLRPMAPAERLHFIEHKINNTSGLALVVIDGIADLLSSGINDEIEAIGILTRLMKWTEDRNIHIITVLHMNKGDFNARGVIGSYLMQKAESTISINKSPQDKNISIVRADYCRDMDFEDLAFTINDEGLPVLAETPLPEKPALLQQKAMFEAILPPPRTLTRGRLVAEYMDRSGKKERTANNHINAGLEHGFLNFDEATKGYSLYQEPTNEIPF